MVSRVERGEQNARVELRREVLHGRGPAQRGVRAPVREEDDGFRRRRPDERRAFRDFRERIARRMCRSRVFVFARRTRRV